MNTDLGSGEKSPPADVEPARQPALLPDEGSEDSESDKYLHGMPLILMALSLMIGVLTVALDNSIISTAIPKMTSEFNSLSDVRLYCGSMIIITQIVEMRKRPLFLGIITLGGLTGAIICFYYPSTLGGAVNKDRPLKQKILGLGLKSAVILTATLVCLFLALQWGGTVYPWRDSRVWGCLLGFGFLLILFSYIQVRQKEDALIPLRILSQRSVLLGCLFSCLLQGAMMTQAYHLPFYFQAVKGDDPQESGINILPHGVTVSIATLISGTAMTLSGYYVPFMWFGAALFTTGGGLLYTLSQSSPIGRWFGFQLMAGAGYGTTVQIPIFAIQVVLSTADIPLGTTMVIIAQSFGGAVGLAIAQNVFQNYLSQELNKIQGIDVAAVVAAGGVELEKVVRSGSLAMVRNAFQVAIANAFLVAVGLGGVAFLVSLGMERKRINKSKSN
ncbi:uncharacterized protein NECHADRAFT_37173 [Fusarium vanettenii 77-13-4]|uniref:Major facilitator superfamily (MFS) profile domain-containing protein n=1 Tax=Fusarium vanettenii (strain ATCC MYA-4622 / CBS 123669 / FGSC 9596 / NRRL 45880 / 77-13-4) TaxID=660122 RepID=C7ZFN3_FUSV7|nr:uncharacterized protein NECHADRAFT_37173 [Fusarium vanettenii 77-13-4]EEU37299.1 hypothetical protein NECHADRAFT_37173 [Fusarium vanettenii 77-13-4]